MTETTASSKAPVWMNCATLLDLNAYLRRIKTGGAKAEAIRATWTAAHSGAAAPAGDLGAPMGGEQQAPAEIVTEGEAGDMGDLLDAEERRTEEAAATKDAGHAEAPEQPDAGEQEHPTAQAAEEPEEKLPRPAAYYDALRTRFIDPRMIDVRDGWNVRIDFGDLEELAASILAQKRLDGHGLTNDIRVKELPNGRYELVDGERRWQSVMGLIDRGHEWEFGIPAKVEPADATDADLIIKMFTANQGKPFLPYEEALYYKRLRDSGMTLDQIEAQTGRSDNSIVGALALLQADDDLQEAVIKGTIGATMAKSIAVNVRGNKARQKELVAKAKEAKKTGDKALASQVKKEVDDERRAKAAKKAPNLQLKARKADEAEIAALGSSVASRLAQLLAELGMPHDGDLRGWLAADRELQIAATFGALTALKRVMGVKESVEF